jgi:Flp pilus assembly protein TadD
VSGDQAAKDSWDLIIDLKEWLEEHPEDASAAYKLALTLLEEGIFEEALDYAESCAVLAPKDTSALKLLGMARDYNGLIDEAEKILKHATTLDPSDADSWLCLGSHYYQPPLKDYKEALKHFSRACAADPHNSVAQQSRAEALDKLGRTSEARGAFLEAIKADYQNMIAVKGLAALEVREGNLEKAQDLLRVYLQQHPDDRDAHWTLERVIKKLSGDLTEPN